MKNKTAPIIIAILIPLVSVITAITLVYLKKSTPSTDISFPYDAYIQNPINLNGNKYTLVGECELQLASVSGGRVISVCESGTDKTVAVFVPSSIDANIMTRQRYIMNVSVTPHGAILVNSMKKF